MKKFFFFCNSSSSSNSDKYSIYNRENRCSLHRNVTTIMSGSEATDAKPKQPYWYSREHQTDVTTQYPSVRRNADNYPSTSVQMNFPSPKQCRYCCQKNCVCLNLSRSDKTDASQPPAGPERYRTHNNNNNNMSSSFDRKKSLKLCFDSFDEPEKISVESKTGMKSTVTDFVNLDNFSKMNNQSRWHDCPCKTSPYSTFPNFPKKKTAPNCGCCLMSEEQDGTSIDVKKSAKFICNNRCEDVAYMNYSKTTTDGSHREERRTPKRCTCPVVKVHGMECNVSDVVEKKIPSEKERRKENQICQTDEVVEKKENVVNDLEIIKKKREIVYPAEVKTAVEMRNSSEYESPVLEKFPRETMSSGKTRSDSYNPCERIIRTGSCSPYSKQERDDISYPDRRNKWESYEEPEVRKNEKVLKHEIGVNTSAMGNCCRCEKKERKSSGSDHPRHYFLKIEETEMIDDNDSTMERRKSLEVTSQKNRNSVCVRACVCV